MLCACCVCIQGETFINNFENNTMKLTVNETNLTGLWARSCATIQKAVILKFALRPEIFPSLSKNERLIG